MDPVSEICLMLFLVGSFDFVRRNVSDDVFKKVLDMLEQGENEALKKSKRRRVVLKQ